MEDSQKKVNSGYGFYNENLLLRSFVEVEKWENIKFIKIFCEDGFKPSGRWTRVDDGASYPIYVDVLSDGIQIVADADYIEWSDKCYFLGYLKMSAYHISIKNVSFKNIRNLSCMFYDDNAIEDIEFLDIIHLDNIKGCRQMFMGCYSLKKSACLIL